ncbi:hypothetical protein PRZ48_012633 [Zasmidium cellare]|uniref:ASST-domain-containing protein n=1 Tax=Zasmidium cellare TaxID=395010 RepID=A0ABR0E5F1_ZASCE|nr:hypothetical protein PRZ48_012633 [Zasmidium cellare]
MKYDIALKAALALGWTAQTFALPTNGSEYSIPSEAYVEVGIDPTNTSAPWRIFKTATFNPPDMRITHNGDSLQDGYLFMTPWPQAGPDTKQSAGFIMTEDNELVYCVPIVGVHNLRVQTLNDTPYLTYWHGTNARIGHGYGEVVFADDKLSNFSVNPALDIIPNPTVYDLYGNGANGTVGDVDIHEQQMTNRETILVTAYNNTPFDLSSVGGSKDGWIVDSHFYEVDIATQEVVFSWRASDHLDQIPFNTSRNAVVGPESNGTASSPWDWMHINSIELVGEDYLIDCRHTWSVYLISHVDGSVIWHLDGETGGDFGKLPLEATFRWQHDARAHNVTSTSLDLSLFDNHNSDQDHHSTEAGQSKALVFHLDMPVNDSWSATMTRRLLPPQPFYADAMGSYIPDIGNGNQLVGWGQVAATTEYGPDGEVRYHTAFETPETVFSYRAYKQVWHATPADWDPVLVVENGKAYVSWNGATDVESWSVYRRCRLQV